jgi:hypothetical protein
MIIRITGPVSRHVALVKVNSKLENHVNRFEVKCRIDQAKDMNNLIMDSLSGAHINES